MSGRELILTIAIPAILCLYVLPVLVMSVEAMRMWLADVQGQNFSAGPVTSSFVLLIAQPNGPLGVLQKAMAVLSSGALVATLWTPKERRLDLLLVGILGFGLLAALLTWSILLFPNIYREAWQSVSLPQVASSDAFASIRDPYFTNLITTLASFGMVLAGVKLKGP